MSEEHIPSWQERILALWQKAMSENKINEAELSPSHDWANSAWDQLDEMLQKVYGTDTQDKSREYRLGCAVGMTGRMAEDCGKLFQIDDEKLAVAPVVIEAVIEGRKLVKALNGVYIEAQKIAAEALPSESASFTEGLSVAKRTPLVNSKGLPAFGTERAPLNFLLGAVGMGVDVLGISDYKINTDEFQKFLDLAGSNMGTPERVKKYLSDMKAPRQRGRPKKQK